MANILIKDWWGPGDETWLRNYPVFSEAIIALHPNPSFLPDFCGLWIRSADYFLEIHNSFVWGERDGRLGLLRTTHQGESRGELTHQLLLSEDIGDILEHVPDPLIARVRGLALHYRGQALEASLRNHETSCDSAVVLECVGRI